MAEFRTYDLGHVIQTAEAIKGMRRQGESDKLRDQYMGVQMQNAQQSGQIQAAQEARAVSDQQTEQQQRDAKQHFVLAEGIEKSSDPLSFVQQFAPDFIQNHDAKYGAGSFEKQTPEQIKKEAGDMKMHFASQAGIFANGTPEQQFAAGQQDKQSQTQLSNRLTEIRASGEEARKTAGVKSASTGFQQDEADLMGSLAEHGVSLPAGLRSKDQMKATFRALLDRNSDLTADQIAEKVSSGQISFNANKKSISAALQNFTSGKNGNTIRSLNVAVQHLDQLGELADAMGNGDVQLLNKAANAYATATGQAAPTNFEGAKKIVADEIVKAIVGSGGGVADRQEAAASINAANSPAQLHGAIRTAQGLMTGQLNGMRQQYKSSTGLDDFEDLLLPETRAKLEQHTNDGASNQRPLSPEEAAKLPAGTSFVGLDGVTRVKH